LGTDYSKYNAEIDETSCSFSKMQELKDSNAPLELISDPM